MGIEVIIVLMTVVFGGLAIWFLNNNGKEVEKDRMKTIEEKVIALGGEVVVIEEVDRNGCPYSEQFLNPDSLYKFFRVRYEVEGQRRLGYCILKLEQNFYGPAIAGRPTWIWRF